MRTGLSRRVVLTGLCLAAASGCTSSERKGLSLDIVMIAEWGYGAMPGSTELTVYSDGRLVRWDTTDPQQKGRNVLAVGQTDAYDLAELQALLASRELAQAEESYHEEQVFDGGSISILGGPAPRRITVVNHPDGVPDAVDELQSAAKRLRSLVELQGVDAFAADDPVLVVDVRELSGGFSDEMIVFASGFIDYRAHDFLFFGTHGSLPAAGVYTRRVDPTTLAPLREALAAAAAAGLSPRYRRPEPPPAAPGKPSVSEFEVPGTRHRLWLAEPTGRVESDIGATVPPALERLFREIEALRMNFGAPSDERSRP